MRACDKATSPLPATHVATPGRPGNAGGHGGRGLPVAAADRQLTDLDSPHQSTTELYEVIVLT
jgi:hypothetical protein